MPGRRSGRRRANDQRVRVKTRRGPSRGGWKLKRDSQDVQVGVHARKSFGHQAGRGNRARAGESENQASAGVEQSKTHLKSSSGRVALLLLGSLGARLTAGALPSR